MSTQHYTPPHSPTPLYPFRLHPDASAHRLECVENLCSCSYRWLHVRVQVTTASLHGGQDLGMFYSSLHCSAQCYSWHLPPPVLLLLHPWLTWGPTGTAPAPSGQLLGSSGQETQHEAVLQCSYTDTWKFIYINLFLPICVLTLVKGGDVDIVL